VSAPVERVVSYSTTSTPAIALKAPFSLEGAIQIAGTIHLVTSCLHAQRPGGSFCLAHRRRWPQWFASARRATRGTFGAASLRSKRLAAKSGHLIDHTRLRNVRLSESSPLDPDHVDVFVSREHGTVRRAVVTVNERDQLPGVLGGAGLVQSLEGAQDRTEPVAEHL
jgi:hypothetical protein